MQTSSVEICNELAIVTCIYIIIVLKAPTAEQSWPLAFEENPFESFAELRVEYAVDDWVERRVGVAEPRKYFERRFTNAGLAEGRHNVDTEKGHPADCGRKTGSLIARYNQ